MRIRVAFRVDASNQMGTGHVKRCLTLAKILAASGANCAFWCRAFEGNLANLILQNGFSVKLLSKPTVPLNSQSYSSWLGVSWQDDIAELANDLISYAPDLLVVDHYGVADEWEMASRRVCPKIMVIDDLANRKHECDILLDQNWHESNDNHRYDSLVPYNCKKLLGPSYALIDSEYAEIRSKGISRSGEVRRVSIFMGGSDPSNETMKVFEALNHSIFEGVNVDIVLGVNYSQGEAIRRYAAQRSATMLHENLPSLAPLMFKSDLMVGAGGTTTWERMTLGLPALVISVADNQVETNQRLADLGYINYLGRSSKVEVDDIRNALVYCFDNPGLLKMQSTRMLNLVSGDGAKSVAKFIFAAL